MKKRYSMPIIAAMTILFCVMVTCIGFATWIIQADSLFFRPDRGKVNLTLGAFELDYNGNPIKFGKYDNLENNSFNGTQEADTFTAALTHIDVPFVDEYGNRVNLTRGKDYYVSYGDIVLKDGNGGEGYFTVDYYDFYLPGSTYTLSGVDIVLTDAALEEYNFTVPNQLLFKYKTARIEIMDDATVVRDGKGSVDYTKWLAAQEAGEVLGNDGAVLIEAAPNEWYTIEDALEIAAKSYHKSSPDEYVLGYAVVLAGTGLSITNDDGTQTSLPMQTKFTDVADAYPEDIYTEIYEDGELIIPAGVELVVPFNENDHGNLWAYRKESEAKTPTAAAYFGEQTGHNAELIVNKDISVYGTVLVNGVREDWAMATSYTLHSYYATIQIQSGKTVTVKDGGELRSYGFTYGEGKITTESYAKVVDVLNLYGWKGDKIALKAFGVYMAAREGTLDLEFDSFLFPINQFSLANIVCETTINYGAKYCAQASFNTDMLKTSFDAEVEFIGDRDSEDAFLQLSSEDANIIKWVDNDATNNNGDVHFETNGTINCQNLILPLNLSGFPVPVSTAMGAVPFPGNFHIGVASGTLTIPAGVKVKLMPGASLTIEKGATLELDGELYSYGEQNVDQYTSFTLDLKAESVNDLLIMNEPPFGDDKFWKDGYVQWGEGYGYSYPHPAAKDVYLIEPEFSFDNTSPAIFKVAGIVNVGATGLLAVEATGDIGGLISFDIDSRTDSNDNAFGSLLNMFDLPIGGLLEDFDSGVFDVPENAGLGNILTAFESISYGIFITNPRIVLKNDSALSPITVFSSDDEYYTYGSNGSGEYVWIAHPRGQNSNDAETDALQIIGWPQPQISQSAILPRRYEN